MTAREHYEKHLGRVYSWMLGDFDVRMEQQKEFFTVHGILPAGNGLAIDLGAGNGIQSVALAKLGFTVHAVDFNRRLLDELAANRAELPVFEHEEDVFRFLDDTADRPELVVCMGDTLTHFASHEEINKLVAKISAVLARNGKVVVSWRDLSEAREGADRFLLVKSDDTRTLTCFLEYFPEHVIVHDVITEKVSGAWRQSVSSYPKIRLSASAFEKVLSQHALSVVTEKVIGGMIYMIAQRN